MTLLTFGRIVKLHMEQYTSARLDRIYVFKHQLSLFRNCSIIPVSFLDHSLVVCSLSLNSVLTGILIPIYYLMIILRTCLDTFGIFLPGIAAMCR